MIIALIISGYVLITFIVSVIIKLTTKPDEDKEIDDIVNGIFSFLWPFTVPVWLLMLALMGVIFLSALTANIIKKFFEKKPEKEKVIPEHFGHYRSH